MNPPFNPLDWSPVARAAFVAGHGWIDDDLAPPPNALLTEAPAGEVDPIHDPLVSGIARDSDGNALGGVRLPDIEVGQALYIASLLDFEIAPGLPGLVGAIIDLQCAPLADGSVRFANHGGYMNRYVDQAQNLRKERFLLPSDADALIERAAGANETPARDMTPVSSRKSRTKVAAGNESCADVGRTMARWLYRTAKPGMPGCSAERSASVP